MKKIILWFTLVFIGLLAEAQITFQKTYGGIGRDFGTSIQQTTDGGYIVVGETNGFNGSTASLDVFLIKIDINGDTLWTKTFSISNENHSISVQQTTDGGFIIAGYTYNGSIIPSYDAFLIKTDTDGNLVWTKTYDATSNDWFNSVQQTSDSGYIIVGATWSFGAGNNDIYLIKTDPYGDILWTKTYGGTSNDWGSSVKETPDGGYIIIGIHGNTNGYGDLYLIKTDLSGGVIWTKSFGGPFGMQGNSVQLTSDGGFIITGQIGIFWGTGGKDVILMKTDSIGNLIWAKTYGGMNDDEGSFLYQTTDNGYIIVAYSESFGAGSQDVFLIKTDSIGNLIWSNTYGGIYYENAFSIQQTIDSGYITVGCTRSFGTGDYDVYIIKTDSMGNSGCNQTTAVPVITSPQISGTIFTTITTSPPTNVTSPVTQVNGGSVVSTPCASVDINEIVLNNSFIISPNISKGNFIISFEGTIMKGKVEIFNILGESVFVENIINEPKKEIKLYNISSGIYIVKVFDGLRTYGKKLIIEHD